MSVNLLKLAEGFPVSKVVSPSVLVHQTSCVNKAMCETANRQMTGGIRLWIYLDFRIGPGVGVCAKQNGELVT